MKTELAGVVVLIPAWRPPATLPALVEALRAAGFGHVVVVDDGSGGAFAPLFGMLAAGGVTVLRHAANLGKGRALKTGFNHLLNERGGWRAVVTADADGQHGARDVVEAARAWVRETQAAQGEAPRVLLGVRRFEGAVPWRSRVGNGLTRRLFALASGVRLRDTQTGLRVLPMELLPALLQTEGERYEYEMAVLAWLCRRGYRPIEFPIATIYLQRNRGSHFRPVRDSVRIYRALWRAAVSQG